MPDVKEYTGTWIPAHIMEDIDLPATAKLIYADIAGFKECFASNQFFADRLGVTDRTIRTNLAILEQKGYVVRTEFNGRTRTLIPIRDNPNFQADRKKTSEGAEENFRSDRKKTSDIDTHINNSIDKEINKEKAIKVVDPEIAKLFSNWELVFGFKPKSPSAERTFIVKLIKNHGPDRVSGAITAAYAIRDTEYAPVITSFRDLWYKWEKLEAFYRRKQGEQTKHSITITE